jgi:hypothetical protein
MEYNNFINHSITLEHAFSLIKSNKNNSYVWYSVKNKKGCIFELGGRNLNDKLELKAYIPKFENGDYVKHENGYINHDYSIDNTGELSFPSCYVRPNKTMNTEDFLKFLNRKDFRKYTPKIQIKKYVVEEYYYTYSYDQR